MTSHMTISVSDMGNSQTMSDDISRSIASAVSQAANVHVHLYTERRFSIHISYVAA